MNWAHLFWMGVGGAIVVPIGQSAFNAISGQAVPALSTDYTVQNIEVGFITGVILGLLMEYVLKGN